MNPMLYDAQSALGFIVSQTANIEARVYQTKYPSFDYAALVPVVTEGNEWARSTVFYSEDIAGKADWLTANANDMPYAELERSKFEHAFHMAGIGYQWNMEEIEQARMLGIPLTDRKANAARRIAEQKLWSIAMTGDSEKGWTGLINDAGVTAGDVAADGTGSVTWWADKTPDQILRDINAGITGVYTGTSEAEMADTVLMPTASYLSLASTPRSANSDTTVLTYLLANNAYTAETGRPLMVRALRSLATADPGGDGRVVVYRRDPEVLRFHLPMPHRFLAPWQNGPMNWMVSGIFRTGGTEIRLPKAIRYLDGVLNS